MKPIILHIYIYSMKLNDFPSYFWNIHPVRGLSGHEKSQIIAQLYPYFILDFILSMVVA